MADARVPAHAALVRRFANTVDEEDGADEIASPTGLTGWLRDEGLLGDGHRATGRDVRLAATLRAGLRSLLDAHHDGVPEYPAPAFVRACAALPLRLTFDAGSPRLAPDQAGVRGALAQVLVAVADGRHDGSWERLKICPADTCRVAFYDASRNRSRTWCSMQVCGNRTKTRAYRARRSRAGP
jgi:predicted RNA-binding Zn ribbon-like protein